MKDLSCVDTKLYQEIVFVTESGNLVQDGGDLSKALEHYVQAWELIPDPKLEWEISGWVASCLFSIYFDLSNYHAAKEWALTALDMRDSDIDTAPLIDLGMVCYELGQNDEAIKYFDQAYQFGQARAFQGRPEKYLSFYIQNKKADPQ